MQLVGWHLNLGFAPTLARPLLTAPATRKPVRLSALLTAAFGASRWRTRLSTPTVLLRRTGAVLSALAILASTHPFSPVPALAAGNPIVVENQQPGSGGWRIGYLVADDTTGQIKGYASSASVNQNDTINLYVTVNPAQTYTIDIYRMGWYAGLGGRLRLHQTGLQGFQQQACASDPVTGLIACHWTPSFSITIPSDWTSGIYFALLTNAAGFQNYVTFVVKDGRPATFLYQRSVATDEAYNNYPNDGLTGKSLYAYNSYGALTIGGDTRAVKVSFDRPFAGNGAQMVLTWEIQLVHWLEQSGYDMTYSTDVDTHANGAALKQSSAFLSTGHDEYWSKEMYDAAVSARDSGVSLAFFGADHVSWQVRFEPSDSGVPNRVLVCYKNAAIDPVQGPTTTTAWRDPTLNRPQQVLTGVQTSGQVNWGSNADYVVTNSSHWVYAGTGLKDGDKIQGLVGYEMDRFMPDNPAPNSTNRTLLSGSPFINWNGAATYANSSIYQAPSGAWVFATGTFSWSWALDNMDPNMVDSRIQKATANVLNAFVFGEPVVHDLKLSAPTVVTASQAFTVTVVGENSKANTVGGYAGTVHFSSSDSSTGVTLPADTTLTNGQGSFTVTLNTAAPQTLTVSDTANSLSTTVNLAVSAAPGPAAPVLGTAAGFTVLGGAGVTCTGSNVAGEVGSVLTVTQTSCTIAATDAGSAAATTAFADFGVAYGMTAAMTCDPANNLTGQELGGMTLKPNVYCFNSTAALSTGTLTLDGPANGIWIFQIGSAITTATANVVMINGGQPCNVFWELGTAATIGAGTAFQGNILAGSAITFTGASSSLVGRALAKTAVTMTGANISAACKPATVNLPVSASPAPAAPAPAAPGPAAPGLGTAAGFTVLGGAGVTCTGSNVAGEVGSVLTVTQTSCTIAATDAGSAAATTAFADFGVAYGITAAMTCDPANNLTGKELGGMTLKPNVYCFNTTAALSTGTLTLDGPADGVWIFQIGSAITTATANVVMIGGGQPCNVFWELGTAATIGAGTAFQGNILAGSAITFTGPSSSLVGRALAKTAVTMTGATISACK
jgi:Ice-binding-like